jgi:hypothetical protein
MSTESNRKSKSGNRYSGVDSNPWVVKGTSGKAVTSQSYDSFIAATAAADSHIAATGEFAQAVRG